MSAELQPVELPKSYLLLNHGPVTLVTSTHFSAFPCFSRYFPRSARIIRSASASACS